MAAACKTTGWGGTADYRDNGRPMSMVMDPKFHWGFEEHVW